MKRSAVIVSTLLGASLLASPAMAQDEPQPAPQTPLPPPPTVIVANPAPPPMTPDTPAAQRPEGAPRYDLIRINAGARIGYIGNSGFDTYSSNDVLPQFSIDGTFPLLTSGKLVLAAGAGWDVGGRSDSIRGLTSSLGVHRFYVPIEGRYHFKPWLYGFGKSAPGAAAMMASVKDPSVPDTISATGWAFSADASIGASVLMGPRSNMDKRTIRFWLTPEIGYGFTTKASLNMNPNRDQEFALGSDESTTMRALALNGFFWRASVGTTF
jgi:hypothetical protein